MNYIDDLYIDLSVDPSNFIVFHTISSIINIIYEYFNDPTPTPNDYTLKM